MDGFLCSLFGPLALHPVVWLLPSPSHGGWCSHELQCHSLCLPSLQHFWCSVILFFKVLPVSPMYVILQSLQGTSFTTPFFFSNGMGFFLLSYFHQDSTIMAESIMTIKNKTKQKEQQQYKSLLLACLCLLLYTIIASTCMLPEAWV